MTKGMVSILMAALFAVTFLTPFMPLSTGIAVYLYYLSLTAVSAFLCARVMAFSDMES